MSPFQSFGLFASGGSTFVRTKVNRKSASPLRAGPPLLSNRSGSDLMLDSH